MTERRTRREFLNDATGITAATLLGARAFGAVHIGGSDTIQVALVGCGSRGAGAAVNALSVKRGPVKLVAMSDVFEDKVKSSHEAITEALRESPDKALISGLDASPEKRFVGFDGYRHAMDCLRPGDVVILATPPAFRWVHFTYAIEKGLNVFMEKPICVDGPTGKRMLELAERSRQKDLKVAVGLMSRHSRAMQELAKRVQDGELGEIISQYGYRMQGSIATFRSPPKPDGVTDLEYQLRRFHSFLWASGGGFNDFFIHHIDHIGWMKGAWPVKAQGIGGRHYRSRDGVSYIDQNFDSYAVEYTYADGTKFMFDGRNIDGCQERFQSYMHGTKGSAIVSAYSDCGAPSRIYSRHDFSPQSLVWTSKVAPTESNPYQNEWEDFVGAIRDGQAYNEAKYGIEASLVCNMGRMSAHTGREITFQEMLDCRHEFAPDLEWLTLGSAAPLLAGADGRYPVPQPGILTDREY
ncbi:MAG: Gfo/Idh/MocA family oxidoreductase [Phycisphaerales bacterium]|nr:Gfo/Idh/MocA family oxidoreductase [Phycisphaerales bacterium]